MIKNCRLTCGLCSDKRFINSLLKDLFISSAGDLILVPLTTLTLKFNMHKTLFIHNTLELSAVMLKAIRIY